MNRFLAPADESITAVEEFLASHGVEEDAIARSPNSDFIMATVPVAVAETLLKTQYHLYRHTEHEDKEILRVDRPYTLPASVAKHLDFVSPTVRFPRVNRLKVKPIKLTRPDEKPQDLTVTPTFLRSVRLRHAFDVLGLCALSTVSVWCC